jgi:hypothetical protein
MSTSPVPYTGNTTGDHPLIAFVNQWNDSYALDREAHGVFSGL